ncbi:MAG: carbon-nitrogen hydrolase family protein [Geminicoccaceae bacterium]|nr:carbon-nitrogen hydrolase family protein [Geminicoccaceae bacterium]
MTAPFRLAVAQPPGGLNGPGERLRWLADGLPGLAERRVDLLLLPELFMTGYNIGDAVEAWSEPAGGPTAAAVRALARRHGVAIHYGFAERAGGRVYNAAQCFGPDGGRLGGHRKLVLPPGFETGRFARGEGCGLFRLNGVTFATLICYDVEFPETVRHVAGRGAQVVLAPTALAAAWGWVARVLIPARAYENGVFLAYANHAGTENGLAYLGESFVAAPDGEELARATAEPGIVFADLDVGRVSRAQTRLPYLVDRERLARLGVHEQAGRRSERSA